MKRGAPRFELNPRVRPAHAVRVLALAQLDHALARLQGQEANAFHEARKACKKLRALLRLIRPFLASYRAENARLRDVGRELSQGREAVVLVETADALLGKDATLAPLAARIGERPHPESQVSAREAGLRLLTQRRRVAEWPIRDLSAGHLVAGMVASYRRARRAFKAARRRPTPVALHEWRKQAKYHGYQSTAVAPLWPLARSRVKRLDRLSDLLGDHHDLHVLEMTLRRPPPLGSSEQLRSARRAIHARQRRLAQAALRLGRQLFAAQPLEWLA